MFDDLKKIKLSTFEHLLLIIGAVVAYIGFMLINNLYQAEKVVSWGMIAAIFLWLMLLLLFVLVSIIVDSSRQQVNEIKLLRTLLKDEKTLINEEKELVGEEKDTLSALKSRKK